MSVNDDDLAAADTIRDETPELELLELAWGVIANAGWDGMAKTPGWQEAAVRWRDQYFALLSARPGRLT